MSQEKEYIVGLKKGIDFKKFDNEMIIATGNGYIPQRSVTVANQRPLSQRLTHYMLTDEEAENLRHDDRVECVEIPPDQREDIMITPLASQTSNFSKTTSDSGPYVNWGLRRVNEKSNVYGGSTIVSGDYNYTLDGSGIDFVVHDSGIQKDHPEFQDANGVSRVKEINWYTESGLTGTQNANHYRDTDGHGTHVAGIAAGKTYGWAKNADIYALKVSGLEGTGDSGTGIGISDCFDVVKEWHRRKVSGTFTPTDASYTPATGILILTLGNHNFESGEKIRIAPGSLTFTCGKDNFASNHSYPRSSGAPNAAGTDPFYNKDITITGVTSTTITVNIGISSDTSEHRFVSALTGAVEATGDKRLLTKRPTVVNMSWGYTTFFVGISGGIYRGTSWTGTTARTDYGMVGRGGRHPVRVSSVDIDMEELIDAGVHVTVSAGNYKQKIDVEGGNDYDNLYYQYGLTRYYHRGGSPFSANAHIVGNVDSVVHTSSGTILEQKSDSSETGPGVTVWAPGTDIMSAVSNTNNKNGQSYYLDSDFKQCNISGTSMAAPQVAGLIALYLQINPDASVKEVKDWISDNAELDDLYQPGDGTSYTNDRSLLGSSPKFLFNPYNSKFGLTLYSSRSGESSVSLSGPTYTMTASAAVVNEGSSVVITLSTTNVADSTSIPYTITGIGSSDLASGSLTGTFIVGTRDTITLEFAEDSVTEGNETATISLDNGQASVSVLVNDSSVATPTYSLTSNVSEVDEGGTVVITLATTNVVTGTNLPYTVTGINAADLSSGSLTGIFVVGSTNTATLELANDLTTEGEETLTLALDNGLADVAVTVNDTSENPPTPTYSLQTNTASVDEGGTFTITITTTNLANGVSVPYTITGVNSADIGGASLTGNFVVGTTPSRTFNVTADLTTEGTETFALALDNGEASINVTIRDTSLTPSGPGYSLTSNVSEVNEGETLTFTLTGTNIQDGTTVGYTVSGVTSGDISGASLTGNITMSSSGSDTEYNNGALISENNGTVFNRALTVNGLKLVVAGAVGGQLAVPDEWAKKTARTFELMTDPNGAGINTTHQRNFIKTLKGDTGTKHAGIPTVQRVGYGGGSTYTPNWLQDAGIPSYAGLQAFNDSVAQKDMVWYKNINGNNPPTQRRDIEEIFEHIFHTIHAFGIPGAVPGSADAVEMNPDIRIGNEPSFNWQNTALHLAMKEAIDAGLYDPSGYATDWNTDPEKAAVAYTEYTYLVNWSMWDMSVYWDGGSLSPEWDDSLKTPAGMLANNPLGYALFNTYFAPVLSKPNFTTIESIFGENDTGVSGYVADAGSGTGSVTFTIAEDATTEGSESLVFTLADTDSNDDTTGGLSQTITINDTSVAPVVTYALSSSADTVNEGSTFTITLSTSNVANGTNVAYTITGVSSADINNANLTGAFNIQNNTSQLVLQTTADLTTEGNEILNLALDNDEDNVNVTITDSSQGSGNSYSASVTAPSSAYYSISNGNDRNGPVSGNNASFAVTDGDIITFNVSVSGHPFYIKTTPGTGTGNQASGVSGQGNTSGTVILNTTGYTGQTLYYQCSLHSGMYGAITIT